ncbi:MAG: nitrate reductase [Sedimenticolaceae bacterium]
MSLLDFARGTALQWSLYIFVVGIIWRILGAALLMRRKDMSRARISGAERVKDGAMTILTRSLPPRTFEERIRFSHITGYIWHIGYFVVVLFFVPHILFFQSFLGFDWPGLPNPMILVIGAITLATLVVLLVRRMTHPVLKLISTADDYISWVVATLPLITGYLVVARVGLPYETLLGLHVLSFCLLLIWFPFGKLMHVFFIFPSRYNVGAIFARRGVRI